ncbi:MAG: 2TM domain-containing protein [Elainellaceae cyanobacterium]
MPDTYDEAAVQQILALARSRQGQCGPVTRSQLIEISRELQISPANFLAAEEDWLVRQDEQAARSSFDQHRRHQLIKGLQRFGLGATLLLLSDFLATQHLSWSLYLTLGWGIVIVLQTWQIYGSSEESYNRAFRRWWLRQQIGESFKAISERLRSSSVDGDRAVASDNGTASSLSAMGDSPSSTGDVVKVDSAAPDSSVPWPLSGREP